MIEVMALDGVRTSQHQVLRDFQKSCKGADGFKEIEKILYDMDAVFLAAIKLNKRHV
jgi:hypothetical protein